MDRRRPRRTAALAPGRRAAAVPAYGWGRIRFSLAHISRRLTAAAAKMPGDKRGLTTLAFLALLTPFDAAALDLEEGPRGAPALQRNPFQKPAPPPPTAAVAEARATPEPPPPAVWEPELRATLVAGAGSSANVDGRILVVGQEVEGFRLIEIRERRAVFEKDGARRVIGMESTR